MQVDVCSTRISVTFPFAALVTFMLLLCDSEIVLASLFSSFFHEGGHLFFMLLFSKPPSQICFGAFGIRIERKADSFSDWKKEALIALGGILGNILLIVCGSVFVLLYRSLWAKAFLAVNFFIALFNLLPVRQLDFGRFLECIFMLNEDAGRSEKILSIISRATAVCVFFLSVLYNIFFSVNVSLIAVSIYLILITTLKE